MKQKIHIHFGIHRTGTTSIHKTLVSNRDELKEAGYLYPELGVSSRHVKIAWALINKKITSEELISLIKKESIGFNGTIILSSEDFSQVKHLDWLSDLNKEFDVTISILLRRQDLWLESWYNQHIKWPWSKKFSASGIEDFLKNKNDFYWIDYKYLLDSISSIIPIENMQVNVMERSVIPDVTKYFIEDVLSINKPMKYIKEANSSLSKSQLEIVRSIDLVDLNPKQRKKVLDAVIDLEIKENYGSKAIFNTVQRKNIIDSFEESNKCVAEKYFCRERLFEKNDGSIVVDPPLSNDLINKYMSKVIKKIVINGER